MKNSSSKNKQVCSLHCAHLGSEQEEAAGMLAQVSVEADNAMQCNAQIFLAPGAVLCPYMQHSLASHHAQYYHSTPITTPPQPQDDACSAKRLQVLVRRLA
jgi:hypothetical protein